MKKTINIIIFGLLLLIFGSFMFTFQVRQDQVAFRSTFGGQPKIIDQPGLYLKLPWPFQKVYEFDRRVHLEITDYTQLDSRKSAVAVELYYGWKIEDPAKFFDSHKEHATEGRVGTARADLNNHVMASLREVLKQGVDGPGFFLPAPGADANGSGAQNQLVQVEKDILDRTKRRAKDTGISVEFVGFRRVGVPQASLDEVLNAMVNDWQSKANRELTNAYTQASTITNKAVADRMKLVEKARGDAAARVKATRDKARQNLEGFKKDPELAEFLIQMDALEKSVKPGATLILDETMGPFPLLQQLNKPLLQPNKGGEVAPPK